MKLIVYLSFMFIIYELLKLTMCSTYWRVALNGRNLAMKFLDSAYIVFLIYLFFTDYWYVGAVIFIVSVITAYQTMDDVLVKKPFNKKIRGYLVADNIVSILFLLLIVFKETL